MLVNPERPKGSREETERSRLDRAVWPAELGAGGTGLVAVSRVFTM
jgi:hypothetical protein